MARGRGDPRPAGGRSGPVNQQRIRDARLQAAFSRALAAASEILVLSPERVLEVLSVADAERTDQKLAQLGIWLDRFREARAAVGPRVIGGGHG